MKKIHLIATILACALLSVNGRAQTEDTARKIAPRDEKVRLAVMELQSKNISKVVGAAMSDLIRSEMVDTGRFTVVERGQMDAILKEQGFQQTGCTDQACAVQMGKLLSANKVLVGEVNQLGDATLITVRIVDVGRGVADFSTSEKAKNMNELDKAAKTLVEKLTLRMTGQRPVGGPTAADYYLRGIVPGWGQIYAGETTKGQVLLGGFVATGALWTYSYFSYRDKRDAYNSVGPTESKDSFDRRYDDYKSAYNLMVYLGAIWGLIYVYNWVDLLWFTPGPHSLADGIPCGNGVLALDATPARDGLNGVMLDDDMLFGLAYRAKF